MSLPTAAARPANPFSTRHVRPGRLVPLDPLGHPVDCDLLLDRLDALGGRGMLLGPHGSGKSTLLEHLVDRLQDRDRFGGRIGIQAVRTGCRDVASPARRYWLRALVDVIAGAPRRSVVCVDGWERLSIPVRLFVATSTGLFRRGLLVTSHRPGVLPVLTRMEPSRAVLASIVQRLPDTFGLIAPHDLDAAYAAAGGNLREALFDLYDVFERRAARPAR